MNMAITDQHIYNRIAAELNRIYDRYSIIEIATFETVKTACERLHEQGINVQTYAYPEVVADILRHRNLVV